MEGVWHESDTTPASIETALRELLKHQHEKDEAYAPARVLNLLVVADREWRGEIQNRLENVGRFHPSRTILLAVEPGRTQLDAWATMITQGDPRPGELALCHEHVVVDVGPQHLPHLDTVAAPLLATDIATLVWSPHGHAEAVDALLHLAQVVLIDSVNEPDPATAVARAKTLAGEAYIVDLAWLRSTPWRERIASSFDPRSWREELRRITSVTVRHSPESGMSGLLFLGWLSSRLGWDPGTMIAQDGALYGRARGRRQDVELRLEPAPAMSVPGLAGVTVETASGMSVSLDRGPGGLAARRRTPAGEESSWTVMGASRGEAGILGEGIRQALLRDPTYPPAVRAVEAMLQ
jgi:glucose-6-phosphate dehydrogenase assembly protein OpcA